MLMSTDYFAYLMILPATVLIILPLFVFVGWQLVTIFKRLVSGPGPV